MSEDLLQKIGSGMPLPETTLSRTVLVSTILTLRGAR